VYAFEIVKQRDTLSISSTSFGRVWKTL